MATVTDGVPTSVYRYFDSTGEVLYIGVTARGAARSAEHSRSKAWWSLVASSTVTHFADRSAALREEERLIRYWRPPYNTQHRPIGLPPRRVCPVRIPINDLRTMMGRTSRWEAVKDVDPMTVASDLTEYIPLVREARGESLQRNETMPEFRARLKGLVAAM